MKNNKQNIVVFLIALIFSIVAVHTKIDAQNGQSNEKPSLAVFVVGMESNQIGDFLALLIGNELNSGNRCDVITRTNAVQEKLKELREYEQSGNVNEDELIEWGRENNMAMLCLVTSIKLDEHMFTAQLIDVKSNKLIGSSYYSCGDLGSAYLKTASETLATPLTEALVNSLTEQSQKSVVPPQQEVSSEKLAPAAGVSNTAVSSDKKDSEVNKPENIQVEKTEGTPDNSAGAKLASLGGTGNILGNNEKKNGATCNPDGIELVYVEGKGNIPGFYIGKYEVTQAQYQIVTGNNPSGFKGADNPVENVSWNDAHVFLSKLNEMTGRNYRLPTEEEWVYAAQGGLNRDRYDYAGGNNIKKVAQFIKNSKETPQPVGTKLPNSIGVYDMSGNVWEWCFDYFDANNFDRVIRGGSWGSEDSSCRIASRDYNAPDNRGTNVGFRVVLP